MKKRGLLENIPAISAAVPMYKNCYRALLSGAVNRLAMPVKHARAVHIRPISVRAVPVLIVCDDENPLFAFYKRPNSGLITIVNIQCDCSFRANRSFHFLSSRTERSGAETRNEVESPEGKSGYCVSNVIERQISPLRVASRPFGRNDKGANLNHNWSYYATGFFPVITLFQLSLTGRLFFSAQYRQSGVFACAGEH